MWREEEQGEGLDAGLPHVAPQLVIVDAAISTALDVPRCDDLQPQRSQSQDSIKTGLLIVHRTDELEEQHRKAPVQKALAVRCRLQPPQLMPVRSCR